ncbi:MAG: tRNA 4-thiouridine(8) synthase ThiI [Candidatus Moranbacteria bacterium]|nr:tRNA 4-thiouridine(8) synthase ThiI [Candidatus Moranbacteria bacterium]
MKKIKKPKALLLFSGGLDSILAAKILEKQGIRVTALALESYFFNVAEAKKSAKKNGLKIVTKNISGTHFGIVKNPRFGCGAGLNPCIDCHLLMVKTAKKFLKEKGFDFLATGEVLGQRPLSQNKSALALIEKEAGMVGKILRPLSARILPETEMEKSGLADREKLLGISGRSRKEQLKLAKKLKIKYFPAPAGGCILTDKEYSKKLEDLMNKAKKIGETDLALLRLGRHFWLDGIKIILGRNHGENLALKKMAESGDMIIDPKTVPGPTALVRGKVNKKNNDYVIGYVIQLLQKYSKKSDGDFEIITNQK